MEKSILQKNWIRWISTAMVLGIMIAIFVLSAEGKEQTEARSFQYGNKLIESGTLEAAKGKVEESGDTFFHFVQVLVRKAAHVLIYLALGGALFVCYESWLGEQKLNWVWSIVIGIVYAATDEWHQSTVPGRNGSIEDVLLDSGGVIVGVLIIMGIVWLIKRHVRRKASVESGQ